MVLGPGLLASLLRPGKCHALTGRDQEDKAFDLKPGDRSAHQVEMLNNILDFRLEALQKDHNLLIAVHWATGRT